MGGPCQLWRGMGAAPTVSDRQRIGEVDLYVSHQWVQVRPNGLGVQADRRTIMQHDTIAGPAGNAQSAKHPQPRKTLCPGVIQKNIAAEISEDLTIP